MYVCLCHALTDRHVREARGLGANSVKQVFKSHGVQAQCGKCCGCMKDILQESPEMTVAERRS
ncbi:bacterioferritin-associated ferredoxin [Novispirillum sp. DQ9]|uniref:(2Fe-2S)-binding protein n=1 Tax=Novispirillum sp. DQ9 TaxID=3398612 RepID=UPI003C7CD926